MRAPLRSLSLFLTAVMLALPVLAGADGGPAWYEVRRGDHLTRIAGLFGTTLSDLRRANHLSDDVIQPGQRLEIRQPLSKTRARDIRWQRPFRQRGRLIHDFGPYERDRIIMPRTGVVMALPVGSEVLVPANGVLRFLAAMDDMGTLAIIDHGADHHTVLGPLDPDSVPWQPGQGVLAGDLLGRTAPPADPTAGPHLHIELRHHSKAIRPDRLLD